MVLPEVFVCAVAFVSLSSSIGVALQIACFFLLGAVQQSSDLREWFTERMGRVLALRVAPLSTVNRDWL
jgi:hypothetical protein